MVMKDDILDKSPTEIMDILKQLGNPALGSSSFLAGYIRKRSLMR